MAVYFADTSALIKRYLAEVGSAWFIHQIDPGVGNIVVISELAIVEAFSVFARRQREKSLAASDAAQQRADLLFHVKTEYLVVLIDSQLLVQARDLVNRYPLRTLDAIQLASAWQAKQLLSESITFISGDRNLLSASAAEGFSIDDPNAHP